MVLTPFLAAFFCFAKLAAFASERPLLCVAVPPQTIPTETNSTDDTDQRLRSCSPPSAPALPAAAAALATAAHAAAARRCLASSSCAVSGKAAAPKAVVAKKQSVAVPESQLKKRKAVDALKAKQAAAKVRANAATRDGQQRTEEAMLTRVLDVLCVCVIAALSILSPSPRCAALRPAAPRFASPCAACPLNLGSPILLASMLPPRLGILDRTWTLPLLLLRVACCRSAPVSAPCSAPVAAAFSRFRRSLPARPARPLAARSSSALSRT